MFGWREHDDGVTPPCPVTVRVADQSTIAETEVAAERRAILYVQCTTPGAYPPLQHSAEILAERSWRVLALGVALPQVDRLEFARHPNVDVRLMRFGDRGWRQKLSYAQYCLWTLGWIAWSRPQWIYVSDPMATTVGVLASCLFGASVIYHEHDAPNEHAATPFAKAVLVVRRALLQRAKLVVVPNAERGRSLVRASGKGIRLLCVWNCPRRTEAAETPRPARSSATFRIVYHGSIVPARLPAAIIHALALLPPTVKLHIMGYETAGHSGYLSELLALAESLQVRSRIGVQLVVPTREELLEHVRASDVGLALMPVSGDMNESNMTGASNKAFEYLAQGLPLIVSDLPDWRKMFGDAGLARTCNPDDARSLADAIQWFVDHGDAAQEMGERGRQLVRDTWNYEHQFAPVLDVITAAR